MKNVGTAYILWLGGLFGLAGLHRLYNGQIKTGLLWLFTWGLFGIGQLMDLMFIPNMIELGNDRLKGSQPAVLQGTRNPAIADLLKEAEARGGKLSVTQGVMATGIGFVEVEALLKSMVKTGYVEVCNDPDSGIVLYEFRELS